VEHGDQVALPDDPGARDLAPSISLRAGGPPLSPPTTTQLRRGRPASGTHPRAMRYPLSWKAALVAGRYPHRSIGPSSGSALTHRMAAGVWSNC
jgi:hypothetical protein